MFAAILRIIHYAANKSSQDVNSCHSPYLELNVPPPNCCNGAYSEITPRAEASEVFAISLRDIGCEKLHKDMLSFTSAFSERSSFPLLP